MADGGWQMAGKNLLRRLFGNHHALFNIQMADGGCHLHLSMFFPSTINRQLSTFNFQLSTFNISITAIHPFFSTIYETFSLF